MTKKKDDSFANHKRCKICNYSTHWMHDDALVRHTGAKGFKNKRPMSRVEDYYLCSYCYRPEAQHNEIEAKEKAKKELELESFWDDVLEKEGLGKL